MNLRIATPFRNAQFIFVDPYCGPNSDKEEVITIKSYESLIDPSDSPLFLSRDINDFITVSIIDLFSPFKIYVKASEKCGNEEFVRIDRMFELFVCTLGDPSIIINNIPIIFRPEEQIKIYSFTNPDLMIF